MEDLARPRHKPMPNCIAKWFSTARASGQRWPRFLGARKLIVRGQEVLADVTGRWSTSLFTRGAREGFIHRVCSLGDVCADDIVGLIGEAGSFGNGAERHQIVCELWDGDEERLKMLYRDRSWHLNELAYLEHRGHDMWQPEKQQLRARQPGQRVWISTEVFPAKNNARRWG